jgi:hypothetical protein
VAMVRCPWDECPQEIPVPVAVEVVVEPDRPGFPVLRCAPQMASVWAHYFEHTGGGT